MPLSISPTEVLHTVDNAHMLADIEMRLGVPLSHADGSPETFKQVVRVTAAQLIARNVSTLYALERYSYTDTVAQAIAKHALQLTDRKIEVQSRPNIASVLGALCAANEAGVIPVMNTHGGMVAADGKPLLNILQQDSGLDIVQVPGYRVRHYLAAQPGTDVSVLAGRHVRSHEQAIRQTMPYLIEHGLLVDPGHDYVSSTSAAARELAEMTEPADHLVIASEEAIIAYGLQIVAHCGPDNSVTAMPIAVRTS